jgi:hypothetical protein
MKMLCVALVALLSPSIAVAQAMQQLNQSDSLSLTRTCTPDSGVAIKLTTSTSTPAYTSQLDKGIIYWIYCSKATHISFGASRQRPTTAHFKMPPSVFPVYTNDNSRYFGALSASGAGECWLMACR